MGVFILPNEYYSYDDIDATGANYRIVFGERSSGKTYGFKKKCIDRFIANGSQFAYLRRRLEEVAMKRVDNYFADLDEYIQERFKEIYPQYDFFAIIPRTGKFNLYGCTLDPENKTLIDTIGYYFALSQSIYDKSNSYPRVDMICYEEFLVRDKPELPNEFSLFMNFISTIKRKRENVVIYMLGNTVTRNSTMLESMNINVRDIPEGSIKTYQYAGTNGYNTVAVEYTRNYSQSADSESYFYFNNPSEMMIINGKWEVDEVPVFEKSMLQSMRQTPKFALIVDKAPIRLYCYLLDGSLYVSDERLFGHCKYYTIGDKPTSIRRLYLNTRSNHRALKRIVYVLTTYYNNGHILYDSFLTGDDFKQFLLTL